MNDLDDVIARYHQALDAFMKGDAQPARVLFSQRDDVTLANPFGPIARGPEQVAETMLRAAGHYRDGNAVGFDRLATHITKELACIVEVERLQSKVAGRDDVTPLGLRVTTVFRPEGGSWKIVHRHADPITTARPPDSVLPQ